MIPGGGPVCHGRIHTGRCRFPGLHYTSKQPLLAWRQNLFSSLNNTECHYILQGTFSRHHWRHVIHWCGISGSLARGARACSPAYIKQFPMVRVDIPGASFDVILVVDAMWSPTPLQCIIHGMHLYYAAIQNLVYRSGNVQLTTVANIKAPPTCVSILQYIHPTS